MNRAEDVYLDPMRPELVVPPHDEVERATAAPVLAVGVVDLPGAVDGKADEDIVLLQERCPGAVDQKTVGLEGLPHDLIGTPVFLDRLERSTEEVELHQRRLASLPGDRHLGRIVRLEQLTDVGVERFFRHPTSAVGVERLLGQEEAVGAVDVAGRPRGLCQEMKARRALRAGRMHARSGFGLHGFSHFYREPPLIRSRMSKIV